jgi:hypothetical protein
MLSRMRTLLTILAFACLAAPAHASIAFEQGKEIWVMADDGTGARRLAAGQEPHVAPGGATVVYRSVGTGRHVYAVPTAGGPRRRLLTLPPHRQFGHSFYDWKLSLDFAAGGRFALISPNFGKHTLVADLATGVVRRLPAPTYSSVISPDGSQIAWIGRRQPCDLDVVDLASGRIRPFDLHVCPTTAEWGPGGIGLITHTRSSDRLSVLDPATGRLRLLFSARRPFGFREPSQAGTWRLEAFESAGHRPAAWLVRPDGRRFGRDLPRDVETSPAFTPDDRSVVVAQWTGALLQIDLATWSSRRIGSAVALDAG